MYLFLFFNEGVTVVLILSKYFKFYGSFDRHISFSFKCKFDKNKSKNSRTFGRVWQCAESFQSKQYDYSLYSHSYFPKDFTKYKLDKLKPCSRIKIDNQHRNDNQSIAYPFQMIYINKISGLTFDFEGGTY